VHRPDVIEFLAQHHWVATAGELGAVGMSPDAVKRARCSGWLLSPARGVVVLAGIELSFEGRARLAQVAAGAEAFVSGPSAGVLYGLRRDADAADRGDDVGQSQPPLPACGRRPSPHA